MMPKVLKTEADHEQALERVSELINSSSSASNDDELELWGKLIDDYETEAFPIDLPDPIEAIKFRMEQGGLTRKDLAPLLGGMSKVSEVLSRKRSLSLNMIRNLHSKLGIPAEVLLQEVGATLPEEKAVVIHLKDYINEMYKRGWFTGFSGALSDAKEHAEELCSELLRPFSSEPAQAALYRQKVRNGSEVDQYALVAWRARVMQLAMSQKIDSYRAGSVDAEFVKRLARFSVSRQGPKVAQEYLESVGVHLIIEKHLPKTHLDGAAMIHPITHAPIVALTIRHDRIDNFWFTLCHELAHVCLHLNGDADSCFMDDNLETQGTGEAEAEADCFALDALIPEDDREQIKWAGRISKEEVAEIALRLGVHPAIVAGYVRRELNDYRMYSGLIGNRMVGKLFFAKD